MKNRAEIIFPSPRANILFRISPGSVGIDAIGQPAIPRTAATAKWFAYVAKSPAAPSPRRFGILKRAPAAVVNGVDSA